MYKISHDMVPDSLKNLFGKTDQIHDYQTRQAGFNFLPPKPNTNYRKKLVLEEQWLGITSLMSLKALHLFNPSKIR